MQALNINGTTIHYRLAGRPGGAPLVFVNSLGTDWRVWEAVADRLQSGAGGGCRLLFHDKRGHGLSGMSDGAPSIDDHAADLAALLEELEIEPAVICGLSVGGMIALALAAARPDRARALVLCDTGHRIGTAELWNTRMEAVREHGLEHIADGVMERWLSENFRRQQPAATAAWRNMLVRTPADGYAATCAAIRDADLTGAVRSANLPALCLCGTEDLATPPELMRELAGLLPDARYRDIEGAGHLPTIEASDAVARTMQEFLSEHGIV